MAVSTFAFTLFSFHPALALTPSKVADFDLPASGAYLVKHAGELYAFADEGDSLRVYQQTDEDWVDVNESWTALDDVIGHVQGVGPKVVFKKQIYSAFQNKNGVAEVWSIHKNRSAAAWKQSGEDGLGDKDNTSLGAFFKVKREGKWWLYAMMNNEKDGAQLYRTRDGEEWTRVGAYGFTSVAASAKAEFGNVHYVFLVTSDGVVYRSPKSNLSQWTAIASDLGQLSSVVEYNGALYAGTVQDGVVRVLRSTNGIDFVQVGEDSLGNENNESITTLQVQQDSNTLYALTGNDTDGAGLYAFDAETDSWTAVADPGFGNSNNTSFSRMIKYDDTWYIPAKNKIEGVEIYTLGE